MTVFILGAGLMQIPAIRSAKELGWRVVAADANPGAPGASLADSFLPVDLKDREGLAAAARGIRAKFGLDGVFTAGTDFSASVAWVAQELGLPGIPFEAALRASDKLRMREALAAAGVSSPRYAAASSVRDSAIESAGLAFPLVVKPADSMGARGCRAVRDESELAAAIEAALPYSRTERAIVEEYLEGPEFSIDALVLPRRGEGGLEEDRILIRGIADRHIYFDPYFVELGHTMPSAYPQAVIDEVLRVFRQGVRALGLSLGAAKGDIKYCPSRGGAVVGEIAARLSGGYMSGWTYPYASGIDVTREALRLCVGQTLGGQKDGDGGAAGIDTKGRGWVSAERAFISIPGRVAAVEGCVEAECGPYIKQLFLRASPGDRVVFPSNNVEKCGNLISQAPDRETAVAAAEAAARVVFLRLSPADVETEGFLASKDRWPPAAFSLEGAAARELAALPDYLEDGHGAAGRLAASGGVAPFALGASVVGRDWSGRGFAESAALALERALPPATAATSPSRLLAGRFWRALARGGLQAAVYVLDTERELARRASEGEAGR
jgi:biotin carboxylase